PSMPAISPSRRPCRRPVGPAWAWPSPTQVSPGQPGRATALMVTDWRVTNLLASRFWPNRGLRSSVLRLYRSIPSTFRSCPSAEAKRGGGPAARQTLLVATGLRRRPHRRDLEGMSIVSAGFARSFRGQVAIHDAEDPDLVDLQASGNVSLRVNRALVETDVVL